MEHPWTRKYSDELLTLAKNLNCQFTTVKQLRPDLAELMYDAASFLAVQKLEHLEWQKLTDPGKLETAPGGTYRLDPDFTWPKTIELQDEEFLILKYRESEIQIAARQVRGTEREYELELEFHEDLSIQCWTKNITLAEPISSNNRNLEKVRCVQIYLPEESRG